MMGESRRKRIERERKATLSKRLDRVRFDHYAIGTRLSMARVIVEELSWWSNQDEKLIGVVFRDITDNDYGWILLARDGVGRFRWVKGNSSIRTESYATGGLRDAIGDTTANGELLKINRQGDEPNEPVDLLRVPPCTDRTKLHPYFRALAESPGREPARAVVREIGPWLAPSDPHFVEEFQFHQFDQRLWELYLWAAFRELGFDIKQLEAPDFICNGPGISFAVEATTVAPSESGPLAKHPMPKTQDEMTAFLRDYMPIKFGSSLTNKLGSGLITRR